MFRNYLTVAIRNIVRQPGYSAINVIGLAVGMASAVLIASFIYDEYRYTDFHPDSDRIYRVLSVSKDDSGIERITSGVPGGFTLAAKDAIPEIERATRLSYGWGVGVQMQDGNEIRQQTMMVDRDAFEMFDLNLLRGNLDDLKNPYAMFITESSAFRLYGGEDPVGKTFSTNERYSGGDFEIVGVIEDLERHSAMQNVDMVRGGMRFWGLSPDDDRGAEMDWLEGWSKGQGWRPVGSYVKLGKDQDPGVVEQKIRDLVVATHGPEYAETEWFVLQPLERAYLHSRVDYGSINSVFWAGFFQQGDIQFVTILTLISAALLMIACVNYVNLATARYARRAREVGLRKVLGAYRQQLILQFLGESIVLSILGAVVAGAAIVLLMPEFGAFVERDLAGSFAAWTLPVVLFLAAVAIGVIGGLYPALYLASREAVQTLKGPLRGSRKSGVRYGLVLVQFGATAILLAGTLTVYDQLTFLRNKSLGFNASQIVTIGLFGVNRRLNESYNEIKAEFLKHPNIIAAAAAHLIPGARRETQSINAEGHGENRFNMRILAVDEDFIDTYELELIAGRNMSPGTARDGMEILLNETAARHLGWDPAAFSGPTSPLGKAFGWGRPEGDGEVVGIVRDFHIASLKEPIEPVFICKWWPKFNILNLRIKPENIPETEAYCESLWKRYNPDIPFFGLGFLDQQLARQYRDEERLGTIGLVFSGIAISVACLGLLGLAAYSAEQATKEIGVRRTLGASVGSVFTLLSREFVGVVLIGNLVTWPISYYLLSEWLQSFPYRIAIGPSPFLLSFVASFLLTLATVSYQVLTAASRNPVDALRHE